MTGIWPPITHRSSPRETGWWETAGGELRTKRWESADGLRVIVHNWWAFNTSNTYVQKRIDLMFSFICLWIQSLHMRPNGLQAWGLKTHSCILLSCFWICDVIGNPWGPVDLYYDLILFRPSSFRLISSQINTCPTHTHTHTRLIKVLVVRCYWRDGAFPWWKGPL